MDAPVQRHAETALYEGLAGAKGRFPAREIVTLWVGWFAVLAVAVNAVLVFRVSSPIAPLASLVFWGTVAYLSFTTRRSVLRTKHRL